jgi:hypothetical protein
MRVVVVTSCTGEKAASPAYPLTLQDFAEGGARLACREKELAAYQRSAAALYTGQQHVRLMRGVQTFRNVLATGPRADQLFDGLWPRQSRAGHEQEVEGFSARSSGGRCAQGG